jgi:GR25 family glycosyltransferase involved in LPS biosynthesis
MANILNNFFSKVYCINLDKRLDRWEQAIQEFKKIDLEVERFPAIDGEKIDYNFSPKKKGFCGCLLSHKSIIQHCKDNNFESVLILEDDVVISEKILSCFEKNITHIPTWDMIYFGGNHKIKPTFIKDQLYKIIRTYTTQAYAIHSKIYDEILNILQKKSHPIDVLYANNIHPKYECYLLTNCDEKHSPLTFQRKSYSNIENSVRDYSYLRNGLR